MMPSGATEEQSQCAACEVNHDKVMHECSKGLKVGFYPKAGNWKCVEYKQQGIEKGYRQCAKCSNWKTGTAPTSNQCTLFKEQYVEDKESKKHYLGYSKDGEGSCKSFTPK